MNMTVIQVIAIAGFSMWGVGCATSTSIHASRHTSAEVELALRDAERTTFAVMAASVDPEIAEAARRLALGEER
jgi:hypothetical protein